MLAQSLLLLSVALTGFVNAAPVRFGSGRPAIRGVASVSGDVLVARKTFITAPCKSDNDCESGCCGFKSGKCAGAVIAQERDGGCGFGDAQPNNIAAQKIQGPNAEKPGGGPGSGASNAGANNKNTGADKKNAGAANNAGASNSDTSPAPKGTQFITGKCSKDADCASGCCGFNTGKCAGAVIAQERDGGCGFGDAQPNNNAAKEIQGPNAESAAKNNGKAKGGAQGGGAAAGNNAAQGAASSQGANNASAGDASGNTASGNAGAGGFKEQNGKDAQALNAKFASNSAGSSCKDGEAVCMSNGDFAQCAGGKLTPTPCAGGTKCFALPLVNKAGTSVTCTTEADAQARIKASGATGGITG